MLKRLLKLLLRIIPKDKNIWITGSKEKWIDGKNQPNFVDNSKYLYIFLHEKTDKEVYWVTESKDMYKKFKNKNIPILYKYSIKGIYKMARAAVYFSHYGRAQITDILDYGSKIHINLWHGIPLKKIMYDVIDLPRKKKKKKRIKEYLITSSDYLTEAIYKRAFLLDKESILNTGYPRTDIFGLEKKELKRLCEKYSENCLEIIEKMENYTKVFIYMPTWRENNPNYLEKTDLNMERLNKFCNDNNYLFLIKLHPLTEIKHLKDFSNIICLKNDIDVYPLLPFTTTLITDYSSIYFDYLLLNKPIIFLPFDYDKYIENRELYFNYEEITPGEKVYSFIELENKMLEKNDKYKEKRKEIKEKFIENYNFDGAQKLEKQIEMELDKNGKKNKKNTYLWNI